jgi:hypothetical protein
MDAQCRWRHQPAIEAGFRNRVLTIEDSCTASHQAASAVNSSHSSLLQPDIPERSAVIDPLVPFVSGSAACCSAKKILQMRRDHQAHSGF